MRVGLATADLFVVPLSRRLGLTIQPRTRLERYPVDPASVPDFAHDGTTAIARSLNQETVGRARRYVYHHPEDQPLTGLHIAEPDTPRGPQTSDTDRMVHEGGSVPRDDYDAKASAVQPSRRLVRGNVN